MPYIFHAKLRLKHVYLPQFGFSQIVLIFQNPMWCFRLTQNVETEDYPNTTYLKYKRSKLSTNLY